MILNSYKMSIEFASRWWLIRGNQAGLNLCISCQGQLALRRLTAEQQLEAEDPDKLYKDQLYLEEDDAGGKNQADVGEEKVEGEERVAGAKERASQTVQRMMMMRRKRQRKMER